MPITATDSSRVQIYRPAFGLVAALRRYIVMNAKLFTPEKVNAISGDREALDKVLVEAGLNQSERAEFLGVSQSTISRSGRPALRKARKGGSHD